MRRYCLHGRIPHLDDFGKIDGDAQTLKAIVMPMDARSIEEFERAICDMLAVGLLERYEINGKKVLVYPTFDEYQSGLQKRTKSKYPDPVEDSSDNFSEIHRKSTLTEPNLTKPKRIEPSITEKEPNQEVGNNMVSNKKSLMEGLNVSDNYEETQARKIAQGISGSLTPVLVSLVKSGKFWLVEKAYNEYKEAKESTDIINPLAYFNKIIKRLREENG